MNLKRGVSNNSRLNSAKITSQNSEKIDKDIMELEDFNSLFNNTHKLVKFD